MLSENSENGSIEIPPISNMAVRGELNAEGEPMVKMLMTINNTDHPGYLNLASARQFAIWIIGACADAEYDRALSSTFAQLGTSEAERSEVLEVLMEQRELRRPTQDD